MSVVREGRTALDNVSLSVHTGERWVILGPNGCGKTTLLRVMSLYLHPSRGDVLVNGDALGTFDIRPVRPRLAHVSASLAGELRPQLTAHEAVVTARHGALETWWHDYTDGDHSRADECLAEMGVAHLSSTPLATMSSGETQRVLIARALMCDPIAVLFDEPTARLDLGGREQVVALLHEFALQRPDIPIVTVTHHVDEIPPSATHCALMKDGTVMASGAIDDVLTSADVSRCFGTDLVVQRRENGRRSAYAP